MQGYKYTTEQEAIDARQLCATYKGLPNPQGDTLYWVNYNYNFIIHFIYYIGNFHHIHMQYHQVLFLHLEYPFLQLLKTVL